MLDGEYEKAKLRLEDKFEKIMGKVGDSEDFRVWAIRVVGPVVKDYLQDWEKFTESVRQSAVHRPMARMGRLAIAEATAEASHGMFDSGLVAYCDRLISTRVKPSDSSGVSRLE